MPLQHHSPTPTYHDDVYPDIDPTRPELSTSGKTVAITGGGTGIGAAIAEAFVKSGASTIGIFGRTEKSLLATKSRLEATYPGAKIHTIAADISKLESITQALEKLAKLSGNGVIDILVANAGYMVSPGPITAVDPAEWWTGFEINVRGNFNLLRAFTPLAGPAAKVIHVSSGTAHIPAIPGSSGYACSKVGAARLFEYYADEHPEMTVIQFHPGLVVTDLLTKAMNAANGQNGASDSWSAENVPKMNDPAFCAAYTVWAASDEARFLHGKFVWSHWDVRELKEMKPEKSTIFQIGLLGFDYHN